MLILYFCNCGNDAMMRSVIKRERTAEVLCIQHPLGKTDWPCIFDEVRDMLDISIFSYWGSDIRRALKDEELACGENTNHVFLKAALFDMPSTVAELSHALHDNVDFLSTQKKMKASFDLYSTSLKELSKRFSEISEKRGNNLFFQLLHFEDEHEENFGGPAYSLSVNHHAQRITIAFRGSVTAKDFICDWKTSLRSIPNPLAGEARSGRDCLKIHRGFKEYLYDPIIETMSSKGVVENQALVLHLVTKVAKIFEDHPEYHLYTTGHSLGGALAILFTMEAGASKDLRIRKPVTCITIASPRVGNVSFAKAFKELEKSHRVRCLRLVNDDDLIPETPATANVNCLYVSCFQRKIYRHVGATCLLHKIKKPTFTYPRHYNHPVRLFLADTSTLVRSLFIGLLHAPFVVSCQTKFASSHSCSEYYERLRIFEDDLKKIHLNDVFRDLRRDMVEDQFSEAMDSRNVIMRMTNINSQDD